MTAPVDLGGTILGVERAVLLAAHILEAIFFVGMAGSALVVVLSFIEDFVELFHSDEADPAHTPHA